MSLESLDGLEVTDRRLGEGGFGSVFVCQLDEIKVAAKKLSQSEKEFRNLTGEASRLKRLQYGKHIAYTYGFTMKDENLYMVMEYSEHGDLQNYLKKHKESVTYEQKILFCRGILLGLLYCHSMNIFHGDIKCSNVILGKNLEPKLTDFGLSMTVDNIESYCKTDEGSIYWTAPELFSLEEESNFEEFKANPYPTDIYSLGATFCQVSFDGATEFIDSDNIEMDISLGLTSPISKDAFLEEIIVKCCKFDRNERISLDECLTMLDAAIEKQPLVPAMDNKWREIQQDIKTNSRLELPPSFILHRPTESLVVGPSNLSLLEWLCINNCTDAVEYMIQPYKGDKDQIEWLLGISELCKSSEVADFLRSLMQNNEPSHLRLSNFIDNYPQQFIVMLIKAGASCHSYNLLKGAIEKCHNITVQTIVDSINDFKNWAIHDAVKFGNTEAVKILANAGAGLEWKDDYTSNTPLITAIDTESIEIVKILLKFGVDVHSKNSYARGGLGAEIPHKPLYLAALKGNREIVKLLIDAGATIDTTSNEWYLLSQNLEQQGNISMVRFISNNVSGKSNSMKSNSLCTAIQKKQADLVQTLINNKENADEIGSDGYAPLHWAVIVDNEEIVKILIRAGADLDIRTSNKTQNLDSAFVSDCLSECTPLHIAISKRYLGIARVLIESGADFSAKNELQQTIMDIAKKSGGSLEKIVKECAPINAISIQRVMKSMCHESVKTMISNRQVNSERISEFLCIAISSGKTDLVKYLLKHGVNIDKKHQGKTPLGWAISRGNIQIVKILINAGADINARNKSGRIPLIQYIRESNTEMVQYLVDKGADVNTRDINGNAPIHCTNDREIMEILIDTGADVNVKDRDGETSLIRHVKESNIEMVQLLVDKGADVNTGDGYGNAPIHYAGDKEIMEILISAGADLNAKNQNGATLLIQAVKELNTEMVQFLVDNGADVSARDKSGNAPIHLVRDKEVTEIFVTASVDFNVKNQYGATPLIDYVRELNTEMGQFLVDIGADVNARDQDIDVPICYTDDKEIVEILINAGADINAKDQNGRTPLIQYVRKLNIEMVQFLVDNGADINARDECNNAPIHYTDDKETMKILIDAGADLDAKNKDEITFLTQSVKESSKRIVQSPIKEEAGGNVGDECGNAPVYYTHNREVTKFPINAGPEIDICSEEKALLFQSVRKSNAEMVQFLVDEGVDVNARNEYGDAPVHHAYNREVMEILIDAGADINAKDLYGIALLVQRVIESDIEMIQFLVDKGADVNTEDEYGNTPIHFTNDREIMEILISAGADLNAKNQNGATLLIQAVKESNTDMVQFLVDKGADVNKRDKDGNAPIHCIDDREIMEILIDTGADLNAKNQNGVTPLIQNIKESNTEMVQFLVDKGADVDARDINGNAPIYYAKNREVMEILINTGTDTNARNQNGIISLIQYVKESNTEMVQFLVGKGVGVNARDEDGNTPIHFTADKEIMKILIDAGADLNAKDQNGATLLIQSVKESNIEMVKFLVNEGTDVNARDKNSNASIHCTNDREIMEILIDAGADVNVKDRDRETSLIRHVKESNIEIVQFLIYKGADVNARDKGNNTPIHCTKNREMMEILISAGADLNAKNQNGATLLTQAVKELNTEMVQFLVNEGTDVNARDKDNSAPIHLVRDKETAEILIYADANINVKDKHEKTLFDILIREQNRNLSNKQYKRKEVCELLEYLRDINKN